MNIFHNAAPDLPPDDIVAWAEANVRVDGHGFDASRTPQLIEPIRAMADPGVRIGTLIKPVQVGGSTAGEIVANYWAAFGSGLIQYNWQDDQAAEKRWHERIFPSLESNKDIKRTGHRFEELICTARYVNATVRVQGVFMESSLDSDTVPLQINEEVHLWKPGFLGKARRRQTQVWNAKAFDISNASNEGDQLQSSYEDGTMQRWEVLCPGCGQHHAMRFRWDETHPELGGLRWDSADCRMENGRFNYNKLEATIRYQMPCGHLVRDNAAERRALIGRYSAPQNEGAHLSHRSWNFEAVSCDAIRWLSLVQEWHASIRALKAGDGEPMRRFITERECRFYSDHTVPFRGSVVLNPAITKNRAGLPGRAARLWAADKQRGYRSQGELSHYWLVIRDVMPNADSRLVFEGQISTDAELIAILDEHDCPHYAGGVDASWDTKAVLEMCYRHGLNAFMANASHKGWFMHSDKVKRFYAEGKPVHLELNQPPRYNYVATPSGYQPGREEPVVIHYNVAGMLANLFFIRENHANTTAGGGTDFIQWEVPGDVSEEYRQQNEAWERVAIKSQRTGDEVEGFRKTRKSDHMTMCEAYIAMLMDIGRLLSQRLTTMGLRQLSEKP